MKYLPPLPHAFWQLLEEVVEGWREMLRLLHREWKALEMGKINLLPGLAEEKEGMVRSIGQAEERLEETVKRICEAAAGPEPRRPLRELIHPLDIPRFTRLTAEWRQAREEARERNLRHLRYVEEQMELNRRLMEIITGAASRQPLTYSPPGAPDRAGAAGGAAHDRRVSLWLA